MSTRAPGKSLRRTCFYCAAMVCVALTGIEAAEAAPPPQVPNDSSVAQYIEKIPSARGPVPSSAAAADTKTPRVAGGVTQAGTTGATAPRSSTTSSQPNQNTPRSGKNSPHAVSAPPVASSPGGGGLGTWSVAGLVLAGLAATTGAALLLGRRFRRT